MKKIVLFAAAAFACTGAFAQPVSSYVGGSISDNEQLNVVINIPDVIDLTPDATPTLTTNVTATQLIAGGDISLGSQAWSVWSNREFNIDYKVTSGANMNFTSFVGDMGPVHNDGDENSTWAASNIKMSVTGYSSLNADAVHYTTPTSLVTTGANTNLVDEGKAGTYAQRQFTTAFSVASPGATIIGGTYTTNLTFTATQE